MLKSHGEQGIEEFVHIYECFLYKKEREVDVRIEDCVKIGQVYTENITVFNEDIKDFNEIFAQVKYDEGILRKTMDIFHDY